LHARWHELRKITMTLREWLVSAYAWGVEHGTAILVVAILVPIAGTAAAAIGKGGRTDRDGRAIASVAVALGAAALLVMLLAIHAAHAYFNRDLLDGDVRLVVAPLVMAIGCVYGAHRVFPLGELGVARTIGSLGLAFGLCWGAIWFFSMFRGWHVVFWGSFLELVVVVIVFAWYVRRLLRRAFARERS
jgi:hypothetical protein